MGTYEDERDYIGRMLRHVYDEQIIDQLKSGLEWTERFRRDQAIGQALTDCILGRIEIPKLQGGFPDEPEAYVTFRIKQ